MEELSWWRQVDREGALGYLLARQKPQGGFALTLRLPPTIEDTYYSFRSLELLNASDRVHHLADYLSGVPASASSPAKVLFEHVYLKRRAGLAIEGLEAVVATRIRWQPTLG